MNLSTYFLFKLYPSETLGWKVISAYWAQTGAPLLKSNYIVKWEHSRYTVPLTNALVTIIDAWADASALTGSTLSYTHVVCWESDPEAETDGGQGRGWRWEGGWLARRKVDESSAPYPREGGRGSAPAVHVWLQLPMTAGRQEELVLEPADVILLC